MREQVRGVLVCPSCRHGLRWSDTSAICHACAATYPIEDGVPSLFPLAAIRSLEDGKIRAENAQLRARLDRHPLLKRIIDAVRPPLPYDRHGRRIGQRIFDENVPRQPGGVPLILDLGSGVGDGDQLAGLSDETRSGLIRTDIRTGAHVDFLSDAHSIPVADNALDGVIFQGVAEHVARPWMIAAEIERVLKPGGVVFCEAPFIQWYHEDPKDYYRFTEDGLKALFGGCDPVRTGVAIGPVGGVVGVARELLPMLFSHPYIHWPVKWAMAWVTYPLVLVDRLYRSKPRAKTVALAVFLVARKR